MKKSVIFVVSLLMLASMLCACAKDNEDLPNNSPQTESEISFSGAVELPKDVFGVLALCDNSVVYLTSDDSGNLGSGNGMGLSVFNINSKAVKVVGELEDHLMTPANGSAYLNGILYLNYMTRENHRKMVAIDISAGTMKILIDEKDIAGMVYSVATSKSIFSSKHNSEGTSIIECYSPESGIFEDFLTLENKVLINAISVFDEQIYVMVSDASGKHSIVQYNEAKEKTKSYDISFAGDIIENSNIACFQMIGETFYIMNFSGQSAVFNINGTSVKPLNDWSIATETAVSASQYNFFSRNSNAIPAIYNANSASLKELSFEVPANCLIRYIYTDINNPNRMLISLENEETGVEYISIIHVK